jgi:hypothetical protein
MYSVRHNAAWPLYPCCEAALALANLRLLQYPKVIDLLGIEKSSKNQVICKLFYIFNFQKVIFSKIGDKTGFLA